MSEEQSTGVPASGGTQTATNNERGEGKIPKTQEPGTQQAKEQGEGGGGAPTDQLGNRSQSQKRRNSAEKPQR